MRYRYLILAMILTGCGLVDDLEDKIDEIAEPPPPEIHILDLRGCALTEWQAGDTANYQRCDGDPRPPGAPSATPSTAPDSLRPQSPPPGP